MDVFRLAMHPASEGDGIVLSWGNTKRLNRALVDLGRTKNYRALRPYLQALSELELFVITHIDADHIEGAVSLFKEPKLPFKANHIWFNAFAQLEAANRRLPPETRVILGAAQAEKVSAGIMRAGWGWNAQFDSGIVSVDSPEAANPISLNGGLQLTLLSPSDRKLAELIPTWNRELEKARLRTADSDEVEEALASGRVRLGGLNVEALASTRLVADSAKPNGTSIAFIAERSGKRVLFGADAHSDVLEENLRVLGASESNRYKLDCLKVSHHGSRANTSPSLLKIINCTRFAFSTDGSHHGHPDPETIARILVTDRVRKKILYFNFRHEKALQWDTKDLKSKWNYECVFPEEGKEGIEFDI